MLSKDTTPVVENLQIERLRSMTPEERSLFVFQWGQLVSSTLMDQIQLENPELGNVDLVKEYYRRQFPEEWSRFQK